LGQHGNALLKSVFNYYALPQQSAAPSGGGGQFAVGSPPDSLLANDVDQPF
jgi:hypothetical protein